MTWPPAGSKPPVPPRPTPAPKPRPERPSRLTSPGETHGETTVKPQAKATAPTPPQFGHEGIDPLRALLILGLPLAAAAVTLLVLFATPLVWWIAAGVTAAGVLGGVVLRRSRKARGLLKRLPGAGRATSALRRTSNGRFARSPLGRVVNRALGRRPGASPGGRPGGSPSRPKTLGGRLRSLLPSWAGGTRKPSSPNRPGGPGGSSSGGRSGGRMRSLLNRLKPGGGRRPGASGGASPGGSKTKPKSLLGRAASSVRNATKRASRAAASKLFRVRPGASSPSGGGRTKKPKGKGKDTSSGGSRGKDAPLDLGVVWTGAGKAGRLVGRGIGALFGRLRKRGPAEDEDDFDPDDTFEVGIDGTKVNGELRDDDVEEAKARAKARRKAEKKAAKAAPVWPNVDVDEVAPPPPPPTPDAWPDYDVDAYAPKSEQHPPQPPATRSLPDARDHDPPTPSPSVSPPSHREKSRETPRITSANTKHGGTMKSADAYVEMIDNSTPTSLARSCEGAAEQARADSREKEEDAKNLRREAATFDSLPGAANKAEAQKLRSEAENAEQDAKNRLTWAARLDGMARDASAKLAS